jgi:hypothetical protein
MKTRWILFIVAFLGVMIANSISAQTYIWKKYDDFNSGVINPDKWLIDNSCASISIENGRVKFEHLYGFLNDSAWLAVKKNISKVRGIRATVTFDSCTFTDPTLRDVRGRIATSLGTDSQNPDYFLFSEISIEPYYDNMDNPTIYTSIARLDVPNNNAWIDSPLWAEFYNVNGAVPENIMGAPFIVAMEWNLSVPQSLTSTVSGLGKIKYNWEKTLKVIKTTDPTKILLGIGTRSDSGGGECTVYFDDVYLKYAY